MSWLIISSVNIGHRQASEAVEYHNGRVFFAYLPTTSSLQYVAKRLFVYSDQLSLLASCVATKRTFCAAVGLEKRIGIERGVGRMKLQEVKMQDIVTGQVLLYVSSIEGI